MNQRTHIGFAAAIRRLAAGETVIIGSAPHHEDIWRVADPGAYAHRLGQPASREPAKIRTALIAEMRSYRTAIGSVGFYAA